MSGSGPGDLFRMSDGVAIACRRWDPRPGSDSRRRPPVVLIHGLASDSEVSWVGPGMVDALRAAGRAVIAVDARGHGMSEKPHDAAMYGEERMSRDLVELWDALRLQEVDLVGHSMGAVVAMITASSDHRVRKLVLSGVGRHQLDYDGSPLRHFDTAALAAALLADEAASVIDVEMKEFRDEVDETGMDRHALAAHVGVLYKDPFDFDRIGAPTLVIAGASDSLSPDPDLLAAALPDARCLVIDADHSSVKTRPAFIEAVIEFLAT